MDEKYINDCTKDWELLDSNGTLELYSFFDRVDYCVRYAVKNNGVVVYDFDDGEHGGKYNFFEAITKIIK